MADTFTFEEAKSVQPDTFTFEEASGDSGNTVANLAKSVARPANVAVGGVLQGLASLAVPEHNEMAENYLNAKIGGYGGPTTFPKTTAAERMALIRTNPLYRAGQFVTETGQQMDTGTPTFAKKVAEMAGGFLPAVASGPFAPLEIGVQSYGETLSSQYDNLKKQGMSDEDAAKMAIDRAEKSGLTQAAIWTALPGPLKSVLGKLTGKAGASAVTQFMARRAAGAVEGGVLGATSTAAQNLSTGQPVTKDIGASALGLGAVQAIMPRGGPYRRTPTPEGKPFEPIVFGPERQLPAGIKYAVTPTGRAANVQEMSPFERTELEREAEAESRQTETGQQRVYNTVDAALRQGKPEAKQLIRANGTDWYRVGDFWVTDKPLNSMQKRSLKSGRENPVEDALVNELNLKEKAKEAVQVPEKTQTQQDIEDITGVSTPRDKKGTAGRTELAHREIIENAIWKRFRSPLSEYGDKGQMTERQQQRLQALRDYLAKETDVDLLERHWQQMADVDAKYPFDLYYKRLIAERLGHELPEPEQKRLTEGGESDATGEVSNPSGPAPKHPGDDKGGAPTAAGGGGSPRKPASGAPWQEKAPLTERLESPDTFKGKNWTADALKYGASLDPSKPEQLAELRRLEADYSQKLAALPKTVENFDEISKVGNQKQWLTEAIQGATGVSDRDVARASLPADYKPPFPEGKEAIPSEKEKGKEKEGLLTPKEVAAQLADKPASGPQPAKTVTDPVVPTSNWPDVLKELVMDPPPNGALHESKFKANQPTREAIIQNINRKLRLGGDPNAIIKAIQKSRTPSGADNALTFVDHNSELARQELEAERRANMTEEERKAEDKAEADRIAKAKRMWDEATARERARTKTPEELEALKWEEQWSTLKRIRRDRKVGYDTGGHPFTTSDYAEMDSAEAVANAFLDKMNEKYGQRDPGGRNYRPKEQPGRYRFKEDDKVAMRRKDGSILRGTVVQHGGDLWADVGGGKGMRLSEGNWVPDEKIPSTQASGPEFTDEMFRAAIVKSGGIKGKKTQSEIMGALDKSAPGFMQRSKDLVQKLRNMMLGDGLDPDDVRRSEHTAQNGIEQLNYNVADAAKAQYFADREFKGRTQSHAKSVLERATRILKEIEDWANETLKGGGTHLGPDVLAAYLVKGASVLSRGVYDFAKWSDEMVREFGEKSRPYLRYIYDRSLNELKGGPAKTAPVLNWVEKDVAPVVGKAYDAGKAAVNLFVNTFSPTSKAKPGDVDILFEGKGYKEKMMTRAAAALEKAKDLMDLVGRDKQIDFVDRIKKGLPQKTPGLQQVADLLRKWDDKLYNEAKVFRPNINYLDDHYRVLWQTIPGTQGLTGTQLEHIMSKRPWQGNRGFLLQHTLEDMSDGIHRGGIPVTYNPIEMFLLHAQDVMKFVSANRAWENLKKSGAAEFVERGSAPPEGFTRLDDRIAKKYFRDDESGVGEWWVQQDVARMLHNYLSQDWIRQGPFGPIGRALIGLKNLSTMIELGASPFHAVFVTNEVVGSGIGRAVTKMATPGRFIEGATEFSKALPGTIPFVGGLIPGTAGPETLSLGAKLERYAKDPEGFKQNYPDAYNLLSKTYPDFDHMVNDLFAGGGKVGMDDAYKTQWIKGLRNAVKDNNYVGAVMRALPMVNEQMLSPIFNIYIPRLKLGTWLKDYSFELSRRQKDLESGKITREQLARETWAFVDDRFGELNWDNLYWNRTFKSAMQLMFRSVTWKLGNTRAFGKSAIDTANFLKDATQFIRDPKGKSFPKWTQPMGWLVGMAVVTTIQSTIMTKALTGKYPWELAENAGELIKNMTFPRIDKDDPQQRVSVPTYWKDLTHLFRSPGDYISSSMSGELGRIADIWHNKDFYGTKVYNEDDPLVKRTADQLRHLIPVPFSYSSFSAAKQSGETGLKAVSGFMGYTKAPYYISHSRAEVKAAELLRSQLPVGGRTSEQTEKALKEHEAVLAIRRGEMTVDDAVEQGLVPERNRKLIEEQVEGSHLSYQLRTMSPTDSIKVWKLAIPDERAVIHDEIERKIYNNRTLTEEEKDTLLDELKK